MLALETTGLRSAAILCLALLSTRKSAARSATPQAPGVVFRTSSRLVLVDIVTLKDGLPDKTLRRDDFQLFDNGAPVSIKTFDTGFQSSSRPLSLWMIVQCRMPGWDSQGSGLFAGEIHRLLPALEKLNQQDTIAVAHWCDNGDAQLDLMPTTSADNLGRPWSGFLRPCPTPKITTGLMTAIQADPTARKAEALRSALLSLLDSGDAELEHPAYWAPFIIVGE